MKKKYIKICILIFLGLVLALGVSILLYLYFSGWFNKLFYSSRAEININNIDYPDKYTHMSDSDSYKNVIESFTYFDGLDVTCDISAYIEQGSLTIMLLDIEDSPTYFEGIDYQVVSEITIEKSGIYTIAAKSQNLTAGNGYVYFAYSSSDCMINADVNVTYYITKWQQIHDNIISKLPGIGKEYEIDTPFGNWRDS